MSKEYWVSCEEYCYFRMNVGVCSSPEEARSKARQMLEDGSYEKYKNSNGDGDVEIKGFCDSDGDWEDDETSENFWDECDLDEDDDDDDWED